MPIEPISISSAGALTDTASAGTGDVTHFSNQELSSGAISTATRQLAHRDNLLAEKMNELVTEFNNDERFVSLPIARVSMPPATGSVISNFRIPSGIEARVVSAAVTSLPAGNARLSIQHNADVGTSEMSFGATSGTAIVDTADEFKGGTQYVSSGELVVVVYNDGAVVADIVASVLIVMRSVGTRAGVVITSGATGAKGDKGDKGGKGDKGDKGDTGSTGSPGLSWRGTYSASEDYSVSDVVRSLVDSKYSAFVCVAANGVANAHAPSSSGADTAYWQLLVSAGADGATGAKGDTGSTGNTGAQGIQGFQGEKGEQGDSGWSFRGEWTESAYYNAGDAVTRTLITGSGTLISTYIATGTNVTTAPEDNTQVWRPMFNASAAPIYTVETVYGTFVRAAGLIAGTATGWGGTTGSNFYTAPPASRTYVPFKESAVRAEQSGLSILSGQFDYNFAGSVVFNLPNTLDGAHVDWAANDVSVDVYTNGSLTQAYWRDGASVGISVLNGAVYPTSIRVRGEKTF